jgi:hypothetical protein
MSDGQSSSVIRHYFVDEAGDPDLFKRHGKVIVGKDGCSQFFLLGLADVAEPNRVGRELNELRSSLLSDPYFNNAPSFDPARKKAAIAFQA